MTLLKLEAIKELNSYLNVNLDSLGAKDKHTHAEVKVVKFILLM